MNAILILNYNDFNTTSNYIHQIKNYKILDLILVVDNNSSDDSYNKLINLKINKVVVIKTDKNKGYASGNNFGLKYLEEQYSVKNVIISNPDIEVSELSIIKMVNYLEIHQEVAAVSGMVYNAQGEAVDNFAWKLPSYGTLITSTSLIIYKIAQLFFKYGFYYPNGQYKNKDYFNVEVITGCFFMIKMQRFKNVSYFDERTFLFGEENILFHKIKKQKGTCTILLNEKVVHHHGISINKNIKKEITKQNIMLESNLIYLKDYLKCNNLFLNIYKLFFNIGKYEKELIQLIKK